MTMLSLKGKVILNKFRKKVALSGNYEFRKMLI